MRTLLLAVFVILVVVGFDQATKFWAVERLTDQPSIEVIGHSVMFSLVYNEGGAMGTRLGSANYYLIAAMVILAMIFVYIWQHRTQMAVVFPLALIAGGAIGNIVDRLRIGKVVDFIDIDIPDITIGSYHLERWWTFNIADAAISCSIIFLLVYMLFFQRKYKTTPATNQIDPLSE